MATNIVRLNVYQIDNRVMDPGVPQNMGFPTTGNILLWDTTTSPTRSLPSGVNVYSMIQIASSGAANSAGHEYYVAESLSQLQTLFNA
jgi:hypothetical protein